MKKTIFLFILILILFIFSCEQLDVKYYGEIKIINSGSVAHRIGFGESSSSIIPDSDDVSVGDTSEFLFIEAKRLDIFEYISGEWVKISSGIYVDGFSFSKGKSYKFQIYSGSPDTYEIIKL